MRGETLVEPTRAIRCFERNLHLGHVGLQPDGVAIFSPPALETFLCLCQGSVGPRPVLSRKHVTVFAKGTTKAS